MPPLHLTLHTNPSTEHRVSWVGRPPESSYFQTKYCKTQVHLLQYWFKFWGSKKLTGTPGKRNFQIHGWQITNTNKNKQQHILNLNNAESININSTPCGTEQPLRLPACSIPVKPTTRSHDTKQMH